jgi:hypothetical protein
LLRVDFRTLALALIDQRSLFLPAPGGAFVGEMHAGRNEAGETDLVWFQARTWYDDGILTDEHDLLRDGEDLDALGEILFRPGFLDRTLREHGVRRPGG